MVVAIAARTIIDARLSMPSLARDVVVRPGVLDRLAASQSQRVTLVCAPAGYGKTTAVVSWLQTVSQVQEAQPGSLIAWYAIEDGDDNLFIFITYLTAAIDRVLPGACRQVVASLQSVDMPSPEQLAALLLADLERLTQRLTLVFDDYHHIHSNAIHQFVNSVLRWRPPMLHLVIIARASTAGACPAACSWGGG